MKRAPRKTKRDFSIVKAEPAPDIPRYVDMEEHEGYRLGEKVWFNTSLVGENYSWGFIREIRMQPCGRVAVTVWDEIKGMWRSFSAASLLKEKPIKERKSRRKG
jgi:hypothetical protein